MSDTARLLGTRTLGACIPGAAALIAAAKADVLSKIAGTIEAQARLTAQPPTLAANLQIAQQIVVSLQAAIAIGAPVLDLQVAALAKVLAELQAQLAAVVALNLDQAGIAVYTYDGAIGNTSTQALLPPGVAPTKDTAAVILAAVAPGAGAALRALTGT
jgi:hypothetical protein